MIQITDKSKCCGCNACGDVCTHKAITFKTDIEGFWYPEVDKNKCTDCGLCEKICPNLHSEELKKNDFEIPACYAAVHKNIEVRFDSTSGGTFTALAEYVYKQAATWVVRSIMKTGQCLSSFQLIRSTCLVCALANTFRVVSMDFISLFVKP